MEAKTNQPIRRKGQAPIRNSKRGQAMQSSGGSTGASLARSRARRVALAQNKIQKAASAQNGVRRVAPARSSAQQRVQSDASQAARNNVRVRGGAQRMVREDVQRVVSTQSDVQRVNSAQVGIQRAVPTRDRVQRVASTQSGIQRAVSAQGGRRRTTLVEEQAQANNFASGGEPMNRRRLKVPEALPDERIKESAFDKIKSAVFRRKVAIQEIIREPTSGGIVFRFAKDKKDIEILLIQDSKDRWTIPKGHIEVGETAKMTARREIEEETGLKNVTVLGWLGKIHFKYRRADKLVLMTTQVYLVQAMDAHETPTPEKWMKGIAWFPFVKALDAVEYDDIEKLMLIAKKKIRSGDF